MTRDQLIAQLQSMPFNDEVEIIVQEDGELAVDRELVDDTSFHRIQSVWRSDWMPTIAIEVYYDDTRKKPTVHRGKTTPENSPADSRRNGGESNRKSGGDSKVHKSSGKG